MARAAEVIGWVYPDLDVEAVFPSQGQVLIVCPFTGQAMLMAVEFSERDPDPTEASWELPGPLGDLEWVPLSPTLH